MKRFREFLAPEGRIFLAAPNAQVMNRRLGYLSGMLDDMTELSENDHLLGLKLYTTESLAKILSKLVFTDRMEGIYLKPFTTNQMVSLKLDREL